MMQPCRELRKEKVKTAAEHNIECRKAAWLYEATEAEGTHWPGHTMK